VRRTAGSCGEKLSVSGQMDAPDSTVPFVVGETKTCNSFLMVQYFLN
jgi:hypothetical protein